MKYSEVIYLSPARPTKVKKNTRFADDEDRKLSAQCRRCFSTSDCCWKYLPSVLVIVLVCATILGIVLALQFSPILHTTDQSNSSTTLSENATTVVSTNSTYTSASTTTAASPSITSITDSYCANWTWNATGVTIAGTGVNGSGLNQLNFPWNIYIDPKTDSLYIADSQNHRIVQWPPNAVSGTVVAGTGSAGSTASELNTPKDVFVDLYQNIYVADTLNERIQVFPGGNTIGSTISAGWGVGEVVGIFMYDDAIYACDYSNGTIWENGSAIAGNHGLGSNTSQLNRPQGFTVDTAYNKSTVYIANSQQHTIVRWLPNAITGTIVAGVNGVPGNSSTTFNLPRAVKIDSYSNLYIADSNNHRIQFYCQYPSSSSQSRTIAGVTGVSGSSSAYLAYPAGVALDSQMNLYVSDTFNHRIQKFQRIK